MYIYIYIATRCTDDIYFPSATIPSSLIRDKKMYSHINYL